jgi:hypothetical protein
MKKLSKEILQEISNSLHNSKYLIIGEYFNNKTPLLIRHLTCNTEFNTIFNNHKKGRGCCPKCFVTNIKKTKEQLQEESNRIHNFEYEIIGNYINTDTKIEIKHKICGNTFRQTPDKHLRNNRCPICYGKNRLSSEILQERSDRKYNGEYTILGDYVNNNTHVLIRHNKCGNEFLQIPNNHLKRKCPNCFGPSNGEIEIFNFLTNNKISFIKNKSFEGCIYKRKLKFDFYIESLNLCIEYDGEQHFRPIKLFGGEDGFMITKERDGIKDKFCKENYINIHRIHYKENIEDKLKDIFNIYEI